MPDLLPVTLDDQIAEAKAELGRRYKAYPRFLEQKKLTKDEADRRVDRQRAIIATLEQLKREREGKS